MQVFSTIQNSDNIKYSCSYAP